MNDSSRIGAILVAIGLLASALQSVSADDAKSPSADKSASTAPNDQAASRAIERAIGFLESDADKWRTEKVCSTCHHGAMSVWALSELRAQGYAVNAEKLAETTKWTKDRFVPILKKERDPRPGWRLVSIAGIYLGVMSHNLPILASTTSMRATRTNRWCEWIFATTTSTIRY